jgi:hypothetical protein
MLPLSVNEVARLLQDHPSFHGVVDLHHLADTKPVVGGSWIVLMLPADGSCGHYVLIDSSPQRVVFFDPFGIAPATEIADFIQRFHLPIEVSHAELQNIASSDCGGYCIYVFMHLQREPLPVVLAHFSRDTMLNDHRLERWASAHLQI